MKRHRFLPALFTLVLVHSASAQEWPRFRGPNGSGISEAKTIPVSWSAGDYNWTAALPGGGNSSPVVWGQRVFVTSADVDAGLRYLTCLDASTGRPVWQREFPFSKYHKHKNNSFASSTPALDAGHVYVLWHGPEASPLVALDTDGNELWRYDLGPHANGQGGASSPIVYGDLVVVSNDHGKGSQLVAVDRRTGDLRWSIPREGKRACYSTPCIHEIPGRGAELIFTHCYEGVIGVDALSGRVNWSLDLFGRNPQRAIASPFIAGDLIFAGSGAVAGTKTIVALRTTAGPDDALKAEEVYRVTRQSPHVPTPLVYGERLYLWADSGIVTCAERSTGKTVWRKRVGGNYFGSPVWIDGGLYCIDLDGTVVVLSATDEYKPLARNPLGEESRSTPAVGDGVLFLRTDTQVFAVGGEDVAGE